VLAPPAPVDRALVELLAAERGLLEVRWPPVVPADARDALLAATFAKGSGRAVAFSLAAFRHCFAAGRDLAREDTILIAAAAAELHPTAVLKGMRLKGTARKLEEASREVARVPALEVGERWFFGDAGLEEAAGALAS
jgi:2-hydroxychromene-2-carboxylate isomerase